MSELLKNFLPVTTLLPAYLYCRSAYQDLKLPLTVKKVGAKVLTTTNSIFRLNSVRDSGPKFIYMKLTQMMEMRNT